MRQRSGCDIAPCAVQAHRPSRRHGPPRAVRRTGEHPVHAQLRRRRRRAARRLVLPVRPVALSCPTNAENVTRRSREEALQQFSAIPFFAAWDPAVLKIYVECGLYTGADGQLKLKMPGIQEAVCFAENYAPFECYELLSKLDERVELRWLVAGKLTA